MKIDLAPRINGKPLLSSSYKEEKQIALVFTNSTYYGT
jgi:hypothetical protein